jgi:hypothetical protein
MNPWRMFVASSNKGYRYARAIKEVIDSEIGAPVCFLWNQGAFEAGKSFLDSLERLSANYNCGLAVFTADDQLGDLMAPRDNVVLEFGLFLGIFGRDRSFLLVENRKELKIPSDYAGIATNRFFPVDEAASDEDHRSAVLTACRGAVKHLKNIEPFPPRPETLHRLEMNWRRRGSPQEFQLFTFCGLCDWQDSASGNEGYVYHLWADAEVGSWIRARVVDEGHHGEVSDEHVMQVEFCNQPRGFPGNVTIRLNKRQVSSAAPSRFKLLRFSARTPAVGEVASGSETSVSIGFRVIDALTTHWEYCHIAHECILMNINAGGSWQEFEVRLDDPTRWAVFQADGNYRYHDDQPDFSRILAVAVEVGSNAKGRPGPGSGTILLRGFHLE